jgi:flagellar motor switch protein FliG
MTACTGETIRSAALLISYLPAAEAEQLLQRMPSSKASAIRLQAAAIDESAEPRRATARRFIREMTRTDLGGVQQRMDTAQPLASHHFLARLLPSRLAAALAAESPRTTAAVLSVLPASKAADVLTLLSEDDQQEVVRHMLHSGPVQEDVLRELADALVEVISRENARSGMPSAIAPLRECLSAMLECTDAATRDRLTETARREGMEFDVST